MAHSHEQNENWRQRWEEGRTGWHRDDVHPTLVTHFQSRWQRVLVPLCGATLDLDWIAQRGAEAVGVELSDIAARKVFDRLDLVPRMSEAGELQRLSAGGITILVGDVFHATPEHVGPLDAIWDRAALVAIDPARRDAYATLLRTLAPGADLLLDVFEYSPHIMEGPPHSIPDAWVRNAFDRVEQLDEEPVDAGDLPGSAGPVDEEAFFVRRAYRASL